ncbi:MAG: acyl-CoA thioesterase [Hyphomicrobiaceae bacterium]
MTGNKRAARPLRTAYPHFAPVETRWSDNDVYGHVNNVVYYAYFDSVVNRYLIAAGGLDIHTASVIGVVVESGCRFHASFAYPDAIEAGLAIGHLGNSSVRYDLGLFAPGEETARVEGWFIHVFVDRQTRRPAPMPAGIRRAFEQLRS